MRTSNVFSWLCATLAGAVLFSCTPKETAVDVVVSNLGKTVFATLEQPSEADTKTYLGSDYKICWHEEDAIAVADGRTALDSYVFQGRTGDTSGEFLCSYSPSGSGAETIDGCLALYPDNNAYSVTSGKQVYAYVAPEQDWANKSFSRDANLMFSSSASLEEGFHFKNVCGVLVIKLYGADVTVNSVVITANGDHYLSGFGYVSMSDDGVPQMQISSRASKTVTMKSADMVLGSSAQSATEFWFALLPGVYESGISITVSGPSGSFTKSTSKSIEVVRSKIRRMAAVEVELIPDNVDLGLPSGTLWATRNLGASSPEQYGDYYAFAETAPKEQYDWTTWKYFDGYVFTKYNSIPDNGAVDYRLALDPLDDAATVLLGSDWRTPTSSEIAELLDYCTKSGETVNGETVVRLTGPNGNHIDLPLAGVKNGSNVSYAGSYAFIPSGNVFPPASSEYYGASIIYYFNNSSADKVYRGVFAIGVPIRPVKSAYVPVTSVSLDRASVTLNIDEEVSLVATVKPAGATYPDVSWESSDTSVATVDTEGKVTPVSVGQTIITVRSSDGQRYFACAVTVENTYATPTMVNIYVKGKKPAAYYTGISVQLTATVSPADARQDVIWSSSDESILWVDENGKLTAVGAGTAIISATPVDECPVSANMIFTIEQRIPSAVDLGLDSGVQWADRNLNANMVTGNGAYFSWAEIKTKGPLSFTSDNYKWYDSDSGALNYSYTLDDPNLQDPDDAAAAILGSGWHMPTLTDFRELVNSCSFEAVSEYNGVEVSGYKVTGPNGNSIFLPNQGAYNTDGFLSLNAYWTATLFSNSGQARGVNPAGGNYYGVPVFWGLPIRPVYY